MTSASNFFQQLGISEQQLTEYLESNANFRSNFYGYVAEIALMDFLAAQPGVKAVEKISDQNLEVRGDVLVTLLDDRTLTVECKRLTNEQGIRMSTTATRDVTTASGAFIPSTRMVPAGQWDILAIASETPANATSKWNFKFCKNITLPRNRDHPELLRNRINLSDLRLYGTLLEAVVFN